MTRRRNVVPAPDGAVPGSCGAFGASGAPGTPAGIDSLQRGLEALRCFRDGENTLSSLEIAHRLELPKQTTRRLLETLEAQGFLLRAPGTDDFGLHVACLSIGYALMNNSVLVRQATPVLHSLANTFGVHALLCVRDRHDMLVLALAQGLGAPGWGLGAGSHLPIADTAPGHAWLWMQSTAVQGEWLDRLRTRHAATGGSARVAAIYRSFQSLEQSRTCLSLGEWRKDVEFVAAPVELPDWSGMVIGCVRLGQEPTRERFARDCAAAVARAARSVRQNPL